MKLSVFAYCIFSMAVFASITLTASCWAELPQTRNITVVFRLDDYSALSSTDMELKVIDAFRQRHVSVTFGIIPYRCAGSWNDTSPQQLVPLGPAKGDILRKAVQDGVVDAAMHGYSHQTIHPRYHTEFAGLDYAAQAERIGKGKKSLEEITGMPVTTFIPPWNSYDLNTLKALEELRFSAISADIYGTASNDSRLKFLPATCGLLSVRDAVSAARNSLQVQPVIVVLFHLVDFREVDEHSGLITYREFCDLMDWLLAQKDVSIRPLDGAIAAIDDLSATRYISIEQPRVLLRLLPERLQFSVPYYTRPGIPLIFRVGAFYLSILAFSVFVTFVAGHLVFPKSLRIRNLSRYASLALLILVLSYSLHDSYLGYRGLVVITLACGVCIGAWWSSFTIGIRTNAEDKKS